MAMDVIVGACGLGLSELTLRLERRLEFIFDNPAIEQLADGGIRLGQACIAAANNGSTPPDLELRLLQEIHAHIDDILAIATDRAPEFGDIPRRVVEMARMLSDYGLAEVLPELSVPVEGRDLTASLEDHLQRFQEYVAQRDPRMSCRMSRGVVVETVFLMILFLHNDRYRSLLEGELHRTFGKSTEVLETGLNILASNLPSEATCAAEIVEACVGRRCVFNIRLRLAMIRSRYWPLVVKGTAAPRDKTHEATSRSDELVLSAMGHLVSIAELGHKALNVAATLDRQLDDWQRWVRQVTRGRTGAYEELAKIGETIDEAILLFGSARS